MRKVRQCCPTYAGHAHIRGCYSVDALMRMYLTPDCGRGAVNFCEVCRERFCTNCMRTHAHDRG